MISLSSTLLPVPLRPSTARVLPLPTVRSIPFKTFWAPKDLCKPRSTIAGLGAVPLGIFNCVVVVALCLAQRDCLVGMHHGKNTRINFTKTTSASMTKREDKTTELVAERPTPSVPP